MAETALQIMTQHAPAPLNSSGWLVAFPMNDLPNLLEDLIPHVKHLNLAFELRDNQSLHLQLHQHSNIYKLFVCGLISTIFCRFYDVTSLFSILSVHPR